MNVDGLPPVPDRTTQAFEDLVDETWALTLSSGTPTFSKSDLRRKCAHQLREHTVAAADGRPFFFVTGDDVAMH